VKTAKCSTCGAAIIWGETDALKRIPLNAEPEKRYVADTIVGGDRVVLRSTFVPHFATCPDAKQHRKGAR